MTREQKSALDLKNILQNKRPPARQPSRPAEPASEFYQSYDRPSEMHKISRPAEAPPLSQRQRALLAVLGLAVLAGTAYWLLGSRAEPEKKIAQTSEGDWYMVKLVDKEVFYGQIKDTAADPVVIDNIYYNYDQPREEATSSPAADPAGIRLVKRGNEAHGPAGSMNIVRAQVLFMEPLASESKVRKAILDYEQQTK